MTGAQVRKARQLLGWTQLELARRCGVRAATVRSYEATDHMPRSMFQRTDPEDRLTMVQTALEMAGVEFTNGKVPAVRLRKPGAST